MVCNEKSNGSNSWSRVQWPASPKTTAPETPPTSSKSTLSPVPQLNQLSPFPYGWKVSSWGHRPPSIRLPKLQRNLMIGVSTLTYSNSGSSIRPGRRQRGRSTSGRHVQMLLHLPRTCARAVWKQPIARMLGWATLPVLEREAVDLSRDV